MIDYQRKFSLAGKTAFITGGSGLLGRESSRALSQAGAHVVILDINDVAGTALAQILVQEGGQATYEHCDITALEALDQQLDALVGTYGRLDIWVNTAYPRTDDWGADVEALQVTSWRANVDMHLNAYAWLSRKAALLMRQYRIPGSIINFGSTYGVVGNDFTVYAGTSMTSPMAYAAIKGGIVNLTRYLASYFGADGIRVNTLCPGGIEDRQNTIFIDNYTRKVPLQRMGRPDEIAAVVVFLASEASSYITGATLMVDGGWTAI